MGIVISKAAEGSYFIPQIGVNNFNISMDKDVFNIELNCNHCPGEVKRLVSKFMKERLLDAVRSAIVAQTPSQITSIVNSLLMQKYPRSVTLYNNIDIAKALVGEVAVQDDHIQVPLNATSLHSKDENNPGPAPEIPKFNPKNPDDIMVPLSP